MIRIDLGAWLEDRAYPHIAGFFRNRIWFGWWWASVCSAEHSNYNARCSRCKTGAWTRTRNTLLESHNNSRWAVGVKIIRRYD